MELTLRLHPDELTPDLAERLRRFAHGYAAVELTLRPLPDAHTPAPLGTAPTAPAATYSPEAFAEMRNELFGDAHPTD
jgi:hypothetical protein